jgi:hypothetical protein
VPDSKEQVNSDGNDAERGNADTQHSGPADAGAFRRGEHKRISAGSETNLSPAARRVPVLYRIAWKPLGSVALQGSS